MLTMTQSAGKQIEPLLNMRIQAPDFSDIDRQFAGLAQTATTKVAPGLDEVDKKTTAAGKSSKLHTESIQGLRREMMHVFGAVGFLVTNFVQLAGQIGGNDKQIQKWTQSMEHGITQGFGLASMLSILKVATGGVAAAVGATVAVGTTLLTFFDDSEKKAERLQRAMLGLADSLRGATVADLFQTRAGLIETNKALFRTYNDLFEQRKEAALHTNMDIVAGLTDAMNKNEEKRKENAESIKLIEQTISKNQLNEAEMRKKIGDVEVEAISDRFAKMRRIAEKEFQEALRQNDDSVAGEETKKKAVDAIIARFDEKNRQINEEQRKERNASALAKKAIEMQGAAFAIDALEAVELATVHTERGKLEIEKKYALLRVENKAREESIKLELEMETLRRTGGSDAKEKIAQLEAQLKAIEAKVRSEKSAVGAGFTAKEAALGLPGSILAQQTLIKDLNERISKEIDAGKRRSAQAQLKIEQDKLDRMTLSNEDYLEKIRQRQDKEHQIWADTHRVAAASIQGITAGFNQMWAGMIIGNRQAVDDIDAVWLAMRDETLSVLGEILRKELENILIRELAQTASEQTKTATIATGAVAHVVSEGGKTAATQIGVGARVAANEVEQASNIQTALSSGAAGTANAAKGASFLPFPLNIIAITAAITIAMALFKGIFKAFGFEYGGRIQKGQVGFFEGKGAEIIAPEKTFVDIARAELIPKMIMQQDEFNRKRAMSGVQKALTEGSSTNLSVLITEIKGLRGDVRDLEFRNELIVKDNRDLLLQLKRVMPKYKAFEKNKSV